MHNEKGIVRRRQNVISGPNLWVLNCATSEKFIHFVYTRVKEANVLRVFIKRKSCVIFDANCGYDLIRECYKNNKNNIHIGALSKIVNILFSFLDKIPNKITTITQPVCYPICNANTTQIVYHLYIDSSEQVNESVLFICIKTERISVKVCK